MGKNTQGKLMTPQATRHSILLLLLLVADKAGFDLPAATWAKLAKNEAKYPVERFRGSSRKYNAP